MEVIRFLGGGWRVVGAQMHTVNEEMRELMLDMPGVG